MLQLLLPGPRSASWTLQLLLLQLTTMLQTGAAGATTLLGAAGVIECSCIARDAATDAADPHTFRYGFTGTARATGLERSWTL